ncbi:MAG TPA: TRAP transporter large permease subunit [Candidatus Thioglobus sp.]|jgi:C4-dicarboxylate transporter DctM subunit|nr:TRAP transporter large permease subunit [Candidatus Thioglobus sp.]HIL20345.1 TRAP transporter large permease subunit [Candidatus Thioglobus sp.]
MTSIYLLGLVLLLLALRQNIITILVVLVSTIILVYSEERLYFMTEHMWRALNNEVLLSIPLFILCGSIMTNGAMSSRLINVMRAATCAWPGGLGAACILSCAFFAAISGSSMVTLLAVGTILYPALRKEGYSQQYSLGAITSAGTLGVIIPPSIPLIIYGISTQTSITDLFLAGLIPGLLLTAALLGYSLVKNRKLPRYPFKPREFFIALKDGIWSLLMPVILLGGIYSGHFTATESAAVALCYALVIELLVYREMKLPQLKKMVIDTSQLVGTLAPIIAIAMCLNDLLVVEQAPQLLSDWMKANIDSQVYFILGLNAVLLIVGTLMDINAAILILAPIILPLARIYGIDPIHLGIIMVINLEIGLLTPPVGFNLVVAMTALKEKFSDVARSVVPFVGMMLVVLMIISFVPELSLMLVGEQIMQDPASIMMDLDDFLIWQQENPDSLIME